MSLFRRVQVPPQFTDFKKYRPFLRLDFKRRCAYCERNENYLGGDEIFEVEHFKPQSKFPELSTLYENLYYVCRKCNAHKSETWPSAEQESSGFYFGDPCVEDLYLNHLQEEAEGAIRAVTKCGDYSSQHIRLNRQELRRWRKLRRQAESDLPQWKGLLEVLAALVQRHASTMQKPDEILRHMELIGRQVQESRERFDLD